MVTPITRPTPSSQQREVEFEIAPGAVYLPVCPKCGRVGKLPGGQRVTFACSGRGEYHNRVRMVMVRFDPDTSDIGEAGA